MRTQAAAVMLVASFLVACDNGPTEPDRVRTPTPTPTPTPGAPSAALQSLRITGPATVAPGETATLVATGIMSDGSSQNYTDQVTWRSANTKVASITSPGVLACLIAGESFVSVQAGKVFASTNLLVLPAGTFRLTGVVLESDLGVPDATVKVTAGVGTGLSTLTDSSGGYRFYGVAGAIDIDVSKAGYTTSSKSITVTDNNQGLRFPDFTQTAGVISMAGAYTLVVAAPDDCTSMPSATGPLPMLPAQEAKRTYSALIDQQGPSLTVRLSGATFERNWDFFIGRLEPNRLTFDLEPGYYDNFGVRELLASGARLSISGGVTTIPSMSGVHATLDGYLYKFDSRFVGIAGCRSDHLLFELTPVASRARR